MSAAGHADSDSRVAKREKKTRRYVRTGEYDIYHATWPGSIVESGRAAAVDLLRALVTEVQKGSARREKGRAASLPRCLGDIQKFTRSKLEPMVRGLFPRAEQERVLALLEGSVVFLTDENIESVLQETSSWLRTSWTLANLYLGSIGAELLGDDAPRIVGLSEGTTCYVSTEYFRQEERFSDFIAHEAAHVFHNCKRRTIGLRETRRREWLLDIDFRKRETFAYACEAWSRLLELAATPAQRRALVEEFACEPGHDDERVDHGELVAILREGARVRNGWKRILARCAPRPSRPKTVAITSAASRS